ncbi:MAG: TonB-dependent receptor [Bacteroidaceae bacterium]|nr:TonB-dependent receptor [Bacteroidaceae bacterium]
MRGAAQGSVEADSSAVSLNDVVVWGSSNGKEIVPSQRLSGKRLEGLSSFSVADAIRYFSGIQLKDYGGVGGLKTVDVRSMGTNHMGVFYDGIQLGNAQNGQVDLSKFSLDNVESISLYNGQKSDICQSAKDYGASGVIYIRTKRPRFEYGKNYNLRLSMKAGSFGVVDPSVLWEQKLSDHVSSSISAEYLHATGKYKFRYRRVLHDGTTAWDTTATRQNGDIESFRVEGGLFGRMTEGVWNAKLYYYTSNKGIPGAIVNNVWKTSQRQWDRNFFAQGNVKKTWGKYELMVNAKFARDYLHYLDPDTTSLYINNEFTQCETYLSVANHYSLTGSWDVALSADYQYNTLDADLANFVHPKRHTMMWVAATTYEWWRLRVMASLLGTHVFDRSRNEKVSHESCTGKLTPAVFLSLHPLKSKELSVRAFYKKSFRMPTFNDLYYTDIGNIALKPEYATQYNVGLHYERSFTRPWLKHIEAKADAYYNQVDNKIVAIPKGSGQYRWMMMNIGKVKIHGLDLSAQTLWQPHRYWTLNLTLNYTYQRAQDYSDPTDNDPVAGTWGRQIAYIPWHSGSVIGNLTYRSWGLNYSFIYVGERYHNSSNIPANHEEPWYTHDVSLTKDFRLGRQLASVALECNNVLNQQYDVILNYPMPGRNWKCVLKWNF